MESVSISWQLRLEQIEHNLRKAELSHQVNQAQLQESKDRYSREFHSLKNTHEKLKKSQSELENERRKLLKVSKVERRTKKYNIEAYRWHFV